MRRVYIGPTDDSKAKFAINVTDSVETELREFYLLEGL
jgi:hypothetical protein